MPLLIDCYNVLCANMPPSLAGLDEAGLCEALALSPWIEGGIVVAIDGSVKPHGPAYSPVPGVRLIYSGPSRSADDVIVELVNNDSAPKRLTVVTNDNQIKKEARRRRAKLMTVGKFIRALAASAGHMERRRPASDQRSLNRSADVRRRASPGLSNKQVDGWMQEFGFDEGEVDRLSADLKGSSQGDKPLPKTEQLKQAERAQRNDLPKERDAGEKSVQPDQAQDENEAGADATAADMEIEGFSKEELESLDRDNKEPWWKKIEKEFGDELDF
jgi:hypothetical protein